MERVRRVRRGGRRPRRPGHKGSMEGGAPPPRAARVGREPPMLVCRLAGLFVALLNQRRVVVRLVPFGTVRNVPVEEVTQETQGVRRAAQDRLRRHPFDQRFEVVLLQVIRRRRLVQVRRHQQKMTERRQPRTPGRQNRREVAAKQTAPRQHASLHSPFVAKRMQVLTPNPREFTFLHFRGLEVRYKKVRCPSVAVLAGLWRRLKREAAAASFRVAGERVIIWSGRRETRRGGEGRL
jgi:hypothetical protein